MVLPTSLIYFFDETSSLDLTLQEDVSVNSHEASCDF